MKNGYADIALIVDRSGSMDGIKVDMEGGIKNFIQKQKETPGECTISLYQFDTVYEPVYENLNADKVPEYELHPRGGTALYDALGKTINNLGEKYRKMPEEQRPEKVFVVTITDGMENSSREFDSEKIKEMVSHQSDVYKWTFVYLGANQDALLAARNIGVSVCNSMGYMASQSGVHCMTNLVAEKVSNTRLLTPREYVLRKDALYSEEDRKLQEANNV